MPVGMPEVEVHAGGEDREDDELETVYECVIFGMEVVSRDAQKGFETRTLGTCCCTRTDHAECQRFSLRDGGALTRRSSDTMMFTTEKTFGARMITDEH